MEKDCGAQINLLSRMLKRRLNVTLQGLGITAIQSRVMFYIMDHCLEGPVFQRDVEQVFSLSRSTATGMLRRESVPSDARLKNLVPTPRAAELDAEVRACLRQTEVLLTRGLSEGQVQLFKETLAAMIRNLDAAGAQSPGPD